MLTVRRISGRWVVLQVETGAELAVCPTEALARAVGIKRVRTLDPADYEGMKKAVREEILDNPEDYKKIVFSKEYKNTFGEIWGEKLKSAPRGFPKDHSEIELIKQKSYAVLHEMTDKQVLDSKFFCPVPHRIAQLLICK